MKKLYLLILTVILFTAGCATSIKVAEPVSETKQPEKTAEVQKKEPVKVVKTVYYTVKETSYYADGAVDEVTVYTYDDEGVKLLKKEVFDSDNVLQEWEQYEYSGDLVSVKKSYDKNNELRNYHEYKYDGSGNLVSDTTYNAKDEVQSRSDFVWDNGRKVKWSVYDGSGALLSTTEYIYKDGMNTKILSLNPAGNMEEYFIIEYNGSGLPVKNTHYSKDDKVLDSRTYEYKDGFLVLETVFRGNGSVKRKVVYSNDEAGNHVEIIYTDSADNVQERVVKEYKSREEISFVTE